MNRIEGFLNSKQYLRSDFDVVGMGARPEALSVPIISPKPVVREIVQVDSTFLADVPLLGKNVELTPIQALAYTAFTTDPVTGELQGFEKYEEGRRTLNPVSEPVEIGLGETHILANTIGTPQKG